MSKELPRANNPAGCDPLIRPRLEDNQALAIKNLFAALADETRLAILSMLAQGEVCVCDITASFKQKQPTISHHLRILGEAGLIAGDKRGKWVYYSLVAGKAGQIKQAVEQVLGAPARV